MARLSVLTEAPDVRPVRNVAVALTVLCTALGLASPREAEAQASFTGLSDLAGGAFRSLASGDGSVVLGQAEATIDFEIVALIWDQANGMRPLRDVLVDLRLGPDLSGLRGTFEVTRQRRNP